MTPQPQPNPAFPNPSRKNIDAIAKLERDALLRRSWSERFSENTAKFIGSIAFLMLNAFLMGAWALINLNLIPGLKPFDRFPFGILALIISAESIMLTIFVLISQNRLMRQSDKRAHLDLQVGLLAEQELTAVVQMLHKLCEHAGVDVDFSKHAKTFGAATDVHKLARELDEKLPSD
ncbi:MAG: DUF1003 domain-containing protein [Candidatus Acidiferrum sp.]